MWSHNWGTRLVAILLGLLASVAGLSAAPSSASPLPPFCSLTGMTTYQWTGAGDGISWDDGDNWSTGVAPQANATDRDNAYICIDAGGPVMMPPTPLATWVWTQALDIAPGTTLTMPTGNILLVFGDQATRHSYIRQGATVAMSGTMGGPGVIELGGSMTWTSTAHGASTMTTRQCGIGGSCTSAVGASPGTMIILGTGVLDVDADNRGVNLFDEYQFEVQGTLKLTGAKGYVAADRGTALRLATTGKFLIANDGGWYEGRTLNGVTTLSLIQNGGAIRKTAGSGSSVVIGVYQQIGTGSVAVDSGTLAMPDGLVQKVQVAAGKTYSLGRCASSMYGCEPVASGSDTQVPSVTVSPADPGGAKMSLQEVNESGVPGMRGRPVWVRQTGLAATSTAPAILKLRFDSSIMSGKTVANTEIWRREDGTTQYVKMPTCKSNGTPPAGKSCVDKRGLAVSSKKLADGDLLMVIRTQVFSRWVAK